MSLQEYYEETFRAESGRSVEGLGEEALSLSRGLASFAQESLQKFLPSQDLSGLRVLELGSGRGGAALHLAKLGAQVTLVDFSATALAQAELIFNHQGYTLRTICGDVTHPDLPIHECFDLIIDSHLLHCLTRDPDRASYYRLIQDHLSERGLFVAETMVFRKKLFIPNGFMLDQQQILWQMIGKWIPVRKILDSLELEKEIESSGLRISYFYYYGQFGFIPHRSFLDLPSEILPAAVRMVLQRT